MGEQAMGAAGVVGSWLGFKEVGLFEGK